MQKSWIHVVLHRHYHHHRSTKTPARGPGNHAGYIAPISKIGATHNIKSFNEALAPSAMAEKRSKREEVEQRYPNTRIEGMHHQ